MQLIVFVNGGLTLWDMGCVQFSGPREDAMAYANWVKEDERFSPTYIQVSPSPRGHAFPRLRLRYKPSLVQVS
jgi:predicted sulfurtransferase